MGLALFNEKDSNEEINYQRLTGTNDRQRYPQRGNLHTEKMDLEVSFDLRTIPVCDYLKWGLLRVFFISYSPSDTTFIGRPTKRERRMSLNLDLPEFGFKDKLPRNIGKQELLIGGGVVLALAIAGMTHWKWFSERGSEGRRSEAMCRTKCTRHGTSRRGVPPVAPERV